MQEEYLSMIAKRRSTYLCGKKLHHSKDTLYSLFREILYLSPSPFNIQSIHIIVLWEEEHDVLWEHIIQEKMRENKKERSAFPKCESCKNSAATIIFLEEKTTLESLLDQYPKTIETTPQWFAHAQGILQGSLWHLLCSLNYAANLQHFNKETSSYLLGNKQLDPSLEIVAQLVFGERLGDPPHKEKRIISTRIQQY